ncbi:MerR family transcriptional regulator (plasmid) [Azospirillum humicireducens]|uniref:MerR family transcriptional regulator n=1 Tax=Azospirillum humicireducens TaxID=1226968 RepID=A0A2R4VW86_9PROT|nr:MerR family transcriptional regulator [Azospirillum humicireducens]AWB08682.1 MerR family transcriptional regulator [Azospirillum humicireducens]
MKIGELSRKTGVSVRMLRYYEAEGLLAPVRSQTGYRDYGPSSVDTVERIRLLGNAGMTLATIRDFLPCSLDRRHSFEPCDELQSKLRMQIEAIDEQSRKLSESRKLLTELLEAFEASKPTTALV